MPDLMGRRYGKLTVTGATEQRKNGYTVWLCRCGCGNETIVGQMPLQSGKTKSCGCLQSETYRDNLKLVDGTSVTMLETTMDRRIANNTSGHTGVYLDKKRGKWVAQITFKGKTHYLGSYAEKQEAVKARRRGEEEFFEPFLVEFSQVPPEVRRPVVHPLEAPRQFRGRGPGFGQEVPMRVMSLS